MGRLRPFQEARAGVVAATPPAARVLSIGAVGRSMVCPLMLRSQSGQIARSWLGFDAPAVMPSTTTFVKRNLACLLDDVVQENSQQSADIVLRD